MDQNYLSDAEFRIPTTRILAYTKEYLTMERKNKHYLQTFQQRKGCFLRSS